MQSHIRTSNKQKIALILTGLFLCFVLLEVGLRIGGYVFLSFQEHGNIKSLKQNGNYRILCLGESTTAMGGKTSYPRQLEEILNERNIGMNFSVINEGIIGAKTTAITAKLEDNLKKYKPNMVITMIGINDEEDTVAYQPHAYGPTNKITFFLSSLKILKLIKLLQVRIINKTSELKNFEMGVANLKNKKAYTDLGWHYERLGELDKTEEIFKKAIETYPENDEAFFDLGEYYQHRWLPDKAEEMFKKAIEINPENDRAFVSLGMIYGILQKFDEAETMFKRAIEIDPENVDGFVDLGKYCYRYLRNFGKAEEMFQKAIEIDPDNDEAHIG